MTAFPGPALPVWLAGLMLALALGHLLFAVARHWNLWRPAWPTSLGVAAQTGIFLVAVCLLAQQQMLDRRLISPGWLALGLLFGHTLFALSLWSTHTVFVDAWQHARDISGLLAFLREMPDLLLRFAVVSVAEEAIYRGAVQPALWFFTGSPALAILATAAAFTLIHEHIVRNTLRQSAEFFVFSLLLGVLYYGTQSLALVIVVHTVRNLESIYLEYLAQCEALGDDAKALAEMERTYEKGMRPGWWRASGPPVMRYF